ncbi:DUF1206 domain-containing protein [Nocardioides sp. GY 10113]|uniref:DUF1206 domain-containing protein n=1 Tax=Nocardioides sp. GY 10113 TaxID=2569761 RepID=UPI0010A8A4E3|nr:DUF1206 domain-containing protein [Nocardioides sp. GY 10113]TIC79767.1 DUF1206 domain-containing protein [Nocardioides sp. GY 10113]TIC84905.1 DUF1206 domain-containing protein [Nocardioides sp. GY 10113]
MRQTSTGQHRSGSGAAGASGSAKGAVARANDHPVVEWGARAGFAASGVLHLVLAWLTVQVTMGSGAQASQSGAVATLSRQPFGEVLLWLLAVGFGLLALWQLTEVVTGEELTDKAKAGGKAVMYGALAWTTLTFALGGHTSSNQQTKDFTRTLMDAPAGQVLVGLLGVIVAGIGAYHVYKGWTRGFLDDLEEHPGGWAVVAGRIGYVAKGISLGAVGVLFVVAAVRQKAGEATGLDGALKSLRDLPAGVVVLIVIAFGLAAYGVYSFARARYARV